MPRISHSHQKLGEWHGITFLRSSRRNQPHWPWFCTFGFQNHREEISVALSHQVCGNLLEQPWEANIFSEFTKVHYWDQRPSIKLVGKYVEDSWIYEDSSRLEAGLTLILTSDNKSNLPWQYTLNVCTSISTAATLVHSMTSFTWTRKKLLTGTPASTNASL